MFVHQSEMISRAQAESLVKQHFDGTARLMFAQVGRRSYFGTHLKIGAAKTSEEHDELDQFGQFLVQHIGPHVTRDDMKGLWVDLARAMEPDRGQQFMLNVLEEIFRHTEIINYKAIGYRKFSYHSKKMLEWLAEEAIVSEWPQVIDRMARRDMLDFASGNGLKFARSAVWKHKQQSLTAMLPHIDVRWAKSDLLRSAVWRSRVDMVQFLLPHSQPKKGNSRHLQYALEELSNIDIDRPFRLGRPQPSESEKELNRAAAREVIDYLLPASDVLMCLRNISLKTNDISYIVPKLGDKLLEEISHISELHPNTKSAIERKMLNNAVQQEFHQERPEKTRRL